MRWIMFLAILAAIAVAGYVAVSGYFLAHTAAVILRVGPLSAALSQTEAPADPRALGYRGDPMAAFALPFETVAIETPLGPAEAWLVPANGAEKGRAVYVHGIAGAREDGYRHLPILHDAGWSVLLVSYRNDRGAPRSPEGLYGFGLLEWPDLEAAVDWFSSGPDDPGLLVVAELMGGAILGQFLAQSPLADRVGAVALDSPGLSFGAVITHLASQSGRPLPRAMSWSARLLLPRLTGLDLERAEVGAIFADFGGPLFLAHGAGDRVVPIGPSQSLASARNAPTTTVWTGADHLGSYSDDPAAYTDAFLTFLRGLER